MSKVFNVTKKDPELALKLDTTVSVDELEDFLYGTGYALGECTWHDMYQCQLLNFEDDELDVVIQAKINDIVVKTSDGDILIYSQKAFNLRYERVA